MLHDIVASLPGCQLPKGYEAAPWHGWLLVSMMRYWAQRRRIEEILDALPWTPEAPYVESDKLPGWRFLVHESDIQGFHVWSGERLTFPRSPSAHRMAVSRGLSEVRPWEFGTWVKSVVMGAAGLDARQWHLVDHAPNATPNPEPSLNDLPETRLWRWAPAADLVAEIASILFATNRDRLVSAHFGTPRRSPLRFNLTHEHEVLAERILAEDFVRPAVADRWASHVGDLEWLRGHDVATVRERHRAWLMDLATGERLASRASLLRVLPLFLNGDERVAALDAIIEREPFYAPDAIDLLRADPTLPPSRTVERLFRRVRTVGAERQTVISAANYLLERDIGAPYVRSELLRLATREISGKESVHECDGKLQVAVLHRVPELALPIVRQTLRCVTECTVLMMAAALVALNRPWCRRELLAAYADTPPHWQAIRVALGARGKPFPSGDRFDISTLEGRFEEALSEYRRDAWPADIGEPAEPSVAHAE